MNTPPDYVIAAAIETAERSPCAKSHRGVVLFNSEEADREVNANGFMNAKERRHFRENFVVVSRGFNGPPKGFACNATDACRASCAKVCLHAEDRAIRAALGCDDVQDLELVHVEVVDGKVVACDGPKCWQCSRLVLDAGVRGVWLYERLLAEPGRNERDEWVFYTADAFHHATLKRCELPTVQP